MTSLIIVAAFSGFFYGRSFERTKTLTQAISAIKNREKIDDKISTLTPFQLCLALGGVHDECSTVLHGVDETASH
ncbi:hypothetical protein [Bartonella sp. F02]|uniref:hypothetical protein n=1 Tax=Bartonella sp. F02 TaxID=2967262 RepID=UPI0022A9AAE4|nr:hypothetical protein [Bartonella sp. F02]MCZ2328883.1 hypothetical protein [Bartonella sp. F02]